MNATLSREELAAWLAMAVALPPSTGVALLRAVGPPEAVLACGDPVLRNLVGSRATTRLRRIQRRASDELLVATRKWAAAPCQAVYTLADPEYPPRLLHLPDPPLLIFVAGTREHLDTPMIAIVGSRAASPQGRIDAANFAAALAERGWTIVSGLALGIDGAAHRGALAVRRNAPDAGSTVAVVATGPDIVYPRDHRGLASQIAEHGAILSEWPPGIAARSLHFPRRNRLIAALAHGTLVVEATDRSGSLITAGLACELGREVFAVPGSIHSPCSRGCHRLIRDGAVLVRDIDDIEMALGDASAVAAEHGAARIGGQPHESKRGGEDVKVSTERAASARMTPRSRCREPAAARSPARPNRASSARLRIENASAATPVPTATCCRALENEFLETDLDEQLTSQSHAVPLETASTILAALGHAPATLDELLDRTRLTAAQLNSALLTLEMAGMLARTPGNRYVRLHRKMWRG